MHHTETVHTLDSMGFGIFLLNRIDFFGPTRIRVNNENSALHSIAVNQTALKPLLPRSLLPSTNHPRVFLRSNSEIEEPKQSD